MKYIIAIPTYNRFDKLTNLINQIQEQDKLNECQIIIYNDASTDSRYDNIRELYPNIIYLKGEKNNGKIKFWVTINSLLQEVKKYDYDRLIFLADDLKLFDNFLQFIKQNHNQNFINLFIYQPYCKQWLLPHWVDGAFSSPKCFWEQINYTIQPIPESRFKDTTISSGVWQQISTQINKLKYNVYYPHYSLTEHDGNEDSKMHPQHRIKTPITACKSK